MKISRAHALFLIFAILGIAISLWSAEHWYSLQLGQAEGNSFCNVTDYWNCDRAGLSDYGAVFNIPLGFFSAVYFFILIVFSFTQRISRKILFAMHLPAWAVSAVLAYVLIFRLELGCLVCYSLDICWMGAGISSLFFRPAGFLSLPSGVTVALVGSLLLSIYPFGRAQDLDKLPSKEELDRFRAWYHKLPRQEIPELSPFIRPAKVSPSIQIVEFSDFACPYCARAAESLVPFLLAQPDVEFVFYPLPFDSKCHPDMKRSAHPHSCDWSKLAICASEQGRFWETHDHIYKINSSQNPALNSENLKTLGLDQERLDACLSSEKTDAKLQELIEVSRKLKVGATPTFFMDGKQVQGFIDRRLFNILLEEIRSTRQ